MKIIKYIFLFILIDSPSYAYIDPGSGSILVQALIFIIAAFGTFITFFKNKAKEIYKKIFKNKSENKKN